MNLFFCYKISNKYGVGDFWGNDFFRFIVCLILINKLLFEYEERYCEGFKEKNMFIVWVYCLMSCGYVIWRFY